MEDFDDLTPQGSDAEVCARAQAAIAADPETQYNLQVLQIELEHTRIEREHWSNLAGQMLLGDGWPVYPDGLLDVVQRRADEGQSPEEILRFLVDETDWFQA